MHADDSWFILRTAGRSTLTLARTLAEDGFEVWTPVEVRNIRIPRANVRRNVNLPLMPSYVFAKAAHLIDLLELAAMPVKPRRGSGPAHSSFSVMHYADSIPIIGDKHLTGLRRIEARRAPKKRADRTFAAGVLVKVRIEGGSFAGMKGTVRKSDNGHTLVCFSNRLTVKIPTFLLAEDDVRLGDIAAQLAA